MKQEKKKFPRIPGVIITNGITMSRFGGIIFLISSFLNGNMLNTAILSGIIGATDLVDGFCARNLNGATNFGKFFDAATDKIFAITLLSLLSIIEPLFLMNFIGELTIGSINSYSRFKHCKPETIFIGKVKSATLFVSMALSFLLIHFNLTSLLTPIIGFNFIFQNYVAGKYYHVYKNSKKNLKPFLQESLTETQAKDISKELCHNIHDSYQPDLIVFIAKNGYLLAKEASKEFKVPMIDIKYSDTLNTKFDSILPKLPKWLKTWLREDLFHNKNIKNKNEEPIISKKQWKMYKYRKEILVVDDMIDSGKTLSKTLPVIEENFKDANINVAVLSDASDENVDYANYSYYHNVNLVGPWSKDSKEYQEYLKEYKKYILEKQRKIKQLKYIEKNLLPNKTMHGSYKDENKVLEYSKIKTKN